MTMSESERKAIAEGEAGYEEMEKAMMEEAIFHLQDELPGTGAAILDATESPIERLMMYALWRNLFRCTTSVTVNTQHIDEAFGIASFSVNDVGAEFVIFPQWKIGDFRVDFFIEYRFETWRKVNTQPAKTTDPAYRSVDSRLFLIVECDGHDFHEKTKEQVRKDKERDRLLKMAGYEVFRFAGSEVWADAMACGGQVCQFFAARRRELEAENHRRNQE